MVTAAMDGRVKVWDRRTNEFRFDLRDKVDCVWQFASRKHIVALAMDKGQGRYLVELWDLGGL